jgi:hypothetical protein
MIRYSVPYFFGNIIMTFRYGSTRFFAVRQSAGILPKPAHFLIFREIDPQAPRPAIVRMSPFILGLS